jgi:hypothetical protein
MWHRLGKIMDPPHLGAWATSHAMVPFLGPGREGAPLELFFSSRDGDGRSHTGRAYLRLDSAVAEVAVAPEPILSPGPLGGFDDSGAMGSCLVSDGDRLYLYYIGWSLGVTVPFATYIGLAVSEDGGASFQRATAGPVIGRGSAEPFLATSPWVLLDEGRWRMWYASGKCWQKTPQGPKHYYRIAYAESTDGVVWEPTGRVCIDFADDSEYAIARPCVVRDDDGYHMWFSCRGSAYRIGYARSDDGLTWARDDRCAGLESSGVGWESQSVEYGFIFDHDERRWILFNGNDYGATGIGLARWDADL